MTKSLSNGSVAGAAGMTGTRGVGTLANIFQDESTGPDSRTSPSAFIGSIELGMSKAFSYSLASQSSGRSSLLAQVRISKVVTQLPVAALWFLVVANVGYAVLAIGLAIWALLQVAPDVHQVHLRLGVSGLAAALFDREKFGQLATADDELFAEKGLDQMDVKKVGFKRTNTGGSVFTVYQPRDKAAEARAMRSLYLSTLFGS